MTRLIYFDNAATSHPKPEEVYRAVDRFQREIGAAPGRSNHRLAIEAGRIVLDARERLANLFNAPDSSRIILTPNCTEALNLAIKGSLRAGDHAIASGIEHNSVMRPLRRLESEGMIELSVAPCSMEGWLDPSDVEIMIRPNTKLIVVSHASNVVGTIQPVEKIAEIARQHEILFLVDAAQSAGCFPIDFRASGIDLVAFSGHKGLQGPQGVGGLIIKNGVDLMPIKEGGTGSGSRQDLQPLHLPDRYESGTPNGPGIAGLAAAIDCLQKAGIAAVQKKCQKLAALLLDELSSVPGVTIYGPRDPAKQTAVVSFAVAGADAAVVANFLDERFGILTRAGYHCSPTCHKTLGTFRPHGGTVRVSLGPLNSADEISFFGSALRQLRKEWGETSG